LRKAAEEGTLPSFSMLRVSFIVSFTAK